MVAPSINNILGMSQKNAPPPKENPHQKQFFFFLNLLVLRSEVEPGQNRICKNRADPLPAPRPQPLQDLLSCGRAPVWESSRPRERGRRLRPGALPGPAEHRPRRGPAMRAGPGRPGVRARLRARSRRERVAPTATTAEARPRRSPRPAELRRQHRRPRPRRWGPAFPPAQGWAQLPRAAPRTRARGRLPRPASPAAALRARGARRAGRRGPDSGGSRCPPRVPRPGTRRPRSRRAGYPRAARGAAPRGCAGPRPARRAGTTFRAARAPPPVLARRNAPRRAAGGRIQRRPRDL